MLGSKQVVLNALVLGIVIWISPPLASSASVGNEINGDLIHNHVKKRELDNRAEVAELDASFLGNAMLDRFVVDRQKRDEDPGEEVERQVLKAEADSIAAADEASAAEKHAIEAAREAAAAEQTIEESVAFEEGENGQMFRLPETRNHHQASGHHSEKFAEDVVETHHKKIGQGEGAENVDIQIRTGHHAELPERVYDFSGTSQIGASSNSHSKHSSSSFDSDSMDMTGSRDTQSKHFSANFDSNMADVETPLGKLLDQSTDLAKETHLVFQIIAKREDYLVKEMESFKQALQEAIQVLQETARESKNRFKRWDSGNFDPYKACVYVAPPEQPLPSGRNVISQSDRFVQEPPPYVELPLPSPEPMPNPNSAALTQNSGIAEDIDLSSIYWLKLPQNEDESSLEKVQRVLGEVRQSGRDVLLIPVLKGFNSVDDMAAGFLRAVRVNPALFQQSSSATKRKLRRKLRIRIRRVL